MRGSEIVKTLEDRMTEKHHFVKWWRNENDFLDYDLVERFVKNTSGNVEIGGIDLLTMDDMWNEVKRVGGARVNLVHDRSGDRIEWVVKGKKGLRTKVCKYTPQALLTIFDRETGGNPVDS
jgi:hypothetical protein